MSAVRIGDAIRQLGIDPPENDDLCVVSFNGEGRPRHATLRECGHLDIREIEQYAYLASGTFRPGTISRYKGRSEENLTSIFWLPLDADLADWLGMEREAVYALDGATLDDLIAKQRADLEEVFTALGIPIHRLDVTGYGLCAYVYVDPASRDQIGPLRDVHKRLVARVNARAGYTLVDPQVSDAGTRITRLCRA